MGTQEQSHLIPLAEDGSWATWRDVVLRSTGFPAAMVQQLTDPELTAAADAAAVAGAGDPGKLDAYRAEYQAAADRLSVAVREIARAPRFREAVTWQNPKLVKLCLDKLAAGEPRNVRGRNHELTLASYVQRYGLKNDTIGFVGPVGWGRWTDEGAALEVDVADQFLARRTVYFENWAIDAIARTLSADPAVRPWLVPRLFSAHRLDGAMLRVASSSPINLTPAESEVLSLVDGARSVRDIADELVWSEFPELGEVPALLAALDALVARTMLRLDLVGTIEAFPERTLHTRLERIGHPETRERALATLARLVEARDRVGAAAGDDVALETGAPWRMRTPSAASGSRWARRCARSWAARCDCCWRAAGGWSPRWARSTSGC
jgi:hypothetical protein